MVSLNSIFPIIYKVGLLRCISNVILSYLRNINNLKVLSVAIDQKLIKTYTICINVIGNKSIFYKGNLNAENMKCVITPKKHFLYSINIPYLTKFSGVVITDGPFPSVIITEW